MSKYKDPGEKQRSKFVSRKMLVGTHVGRKIYNKDEEGGEREKEDGVLRGGGTMRG